MTVIASDRHTPRLIIELVLGSRPPFDQLVAAMEDVRSVVRLSQELLGRLAEATEGDRALPMSERHSRLQRSAPIGRDAAAPVAVISMRFQNPLEIVVAAGAGLTAAMTGLLRVILEWRRDSRLLAADIALKNAEAELRRAEAAGRDRENRAAEALAREESAAVLAAAVAARLRTEIAEILADDELAVGYATELAGLPDLLRSMTSSCSPA